MRVLKASGKIVSFSVARLVVNATLNVCLLTFWKMGVSGILIGNLLTSILAFGAILIWFSKSRGPVRVSMTVVSRLFAFGWPLVLTGLLASVMQQSDRYLLRLYSGLDAVGTYSVAAQIGQGINNLILGPFGSIWSVVVYEVASSSDARRTYVSVFRYFVLGLSLVMLAASIFARPAIALIAPPEYGKSADLVPIICLAYLFYSLHEHFKVPALLAKKTVALLPVFLAAAITNVGLNLFLIPRYGATGAAFVSVITFFVFSGSGLLLYRRIDAYQYPLVFCASVILGMVGSYGLFRLAQPHIGSQLASMAVGAALWSIWALALFGPMALRWTRHFLGRPDLVSSV
jgi:O-antigen/teichoic acid export membrane protein